MGGIVGLVGGMKQSAQGADAMYKADQEYKKAETQIPTENDPLQISTYNRVKRMMDGYRSGASYSYAGDSLNKGLTTGANTVAALAGGNTGGALAAINNIQSSANDNYDKLLTQNEGKGTALIGQVDQLSDNITKRNDNIGMTHAQFNDMRANQDESLGLSLSKSGQANTTAGVTTLGNMVGDFAMMGGGGSGGGGGMGGMMSMMGGGK